MLYYFLNLNQQTTITKLPIRFISSSIFIFICILTHKDIPENCRPDERQRIDIALLFIRDVVYDGRVAFKINVISEYITSAVKNSKVI